MRRKRRSWITKKAITSPMYEVTELKNPQMPFSAPNDAEHSDGVDISTDQGLLRTSELSTGPKLIVLIALRHPEFPNLILHGRRVDNNKWSVPGGHIDPGERPVEGAFREFIEETGVPLVAAEYIGCYEIAARNLELYLFEGNGPKPNVWDLANPFSDPDAEFSAFQYIDPRTTSFELHAGKDDNVVSLWLDRTEGITVEGFGNSLRDLTTERQASAKDQVPGGLADKSQPSDFDPKQLEKGVKVEKEHTDDPALAEEIAMDHLFEDPKYYDKLETIEGQQAPDLGLNKRTVDSLGDARKDENFFEDRDMVLGSKPYDSNGTSPADDMRESLGDEMIVQYATMDQSVGIGLKEHNDRADVDLLNSRTIQTPILLFLLMLIGSCATLSPIQDPMPAPAALNVFTLETNACGASGIGTTACVVRRGTKAPDKAIQIRVPRTNTQSLAATIQAVSTECGYEQVLSGVPGSVVSIPLVDVVGNAPFVKSCALYITLVPQWDKQAEFTFPVGVLRGRVLVLALDYPSATLRSGSPLPEVGFARVQSRVFDTQTAKGVQVEVGSSKIGQVVVEGCGVSKTIPYMDHKPMVEIPQIEKSCTIFGTVQRVDAQGDLSFAIAVEALPEKYLKLRPPVIVGYTVESDPAVSAMDYGAGVLPGGKQTVPRSKRESIREQPIDLRQITTSGRTSWSRIEEGVLVWTLQ
jgi:8-oxo-dGTP pyrophosphatase MutT (NUDIX family)